MARYEWWKKFPKGTRIRFVRDFGDYPINPVYRGETGTVTELVGGKSRTARYLPCYNPRSTPRRPVLRDAITATERPAKRIKRSADPDEQSPYSPSRFLPLKRYTSAMRGWEHSICEITFEDGVKIRAYAFREPGKALDIGRPARAAVEKYRHKKALVEYNGCEGIFRQEVFSVPFTDAVPEIVELRDTETGNIFDIAVANRGTAQMRAAL